MSKLGSIIILKNPIFSSSWLYKINNSNLHIIITNNKISSRSFNNDPEKFYTIFEASNYISTQENLKIHLSLYNVLLLEYYNDFQR